MPTGKENGRWYIINNKRLPSVTTILAETADNTWLNTWKNNTPNWEMISKRATIIGSIAHYRLLRPYSITHLTPPKISTSEWPHDIKQIIDAIDNARNILDTLDIDRSKPIYVEHTVYRFNHPAYAGTLDMLANINGKRTILDIKTSKKLRDDYVLQLGGYSKALKKNGITCEQGMLLKISPSNGTEILEIDSKELRKAEREFINRAIQFWETVNARS